jgi:hypothetical protein
MFKELLEYTTQIKKNPGHSFLGKFVRDEVQSHIGGRVS